ncbi:mavicyanin [Cicer arietinum]|uniref:Mavicyanin n=1 Tax=Cicer arietinum TaxID=3827 RepID=A0A1S2YX53_CICAR|nr:mavicyanin [Cicer arietinum]
MALIKRGVTFLMIIMSAIHVSNASVHKVGDSSGWTIIGNIDYKNWAATKNFNIGDTINFKYNAQFHNVMRVTHAMYKSCNGSSPIATFTSGNDFIKITNYGHHFFLCGVPGHCQAGQKVDINVLNVSATSAVAPNKSPSALASPVPVANAPAAPSPNNASPLFVANGAFGFIGLAMTVFCIFYF